MPLTHTIAIRYLTDNWRGAYGIPFYFWNGNCHKHFFMVIKRLLSISFSKYYKIYDAVNSKCLEIKLSGLKVIGSYKQKASKKEILTPVSYDPETAMIKIWEFYDSRPLWGNKLWLPLHPNNLSKFKSLGLTLFRVWYWILKNVILQWNCSNFSALKKNNALFFFFQFNAFLYGESTNFYFEKFIEKQFPVQWSCLFTLQAENTAQSFRSTFSLSLSR